MLHSSHFAFGFSRGALAASLLLACMAMSPFAQADDDDKKTVIITCTEGSMMDPEKNVVEYYGDVVATHPVFTLTSNKLTLYLATGEDSEGGIDRAVATEYVTIRKNNAAQGEEGYYVGKSQQATFYSSDQRVVLTDWPQVQKDNSLQIATSRNTRMILRQDGTLETQGPARTVLPDRNLDEDEGGQASR